MTLGSVRKVAARWAPSALRRPCCVLGASGATQKQARNAHLGP
ncbi:hypothetical protein C4K09_2306 [Pseudomonas chlororaphis subsp. aureofaciens]|nr:hypothetical protein C4K19_2444 [Pseudomonas chlororaphis subsp. aurantiaca]AZD91860.1 hypothetical protein C4K13_2443 [Pseudomonas chlororaphis subsp. aureofaciens]AZD98342.1 hypothetical protein C4K12_2476 [Pseudomonas chlororaphis subsp. aureofaciens]AZE04572.1 hypothetical protein C4K11_2410 [Pseudomonas chlororaphis subsp. aureofaciens]AZE16767.1 hypothetical protein C4K09_2306 [Pseudomonas chlororaphis subsp. aureofaciens]